MSRDPFHILPGYTFGLTVLKTLFGYLVALGFIIMMAGLIGVPAYQWLQGQPAPTFQGPADPIKGLNLFMGGFFDAACPMGNTNEGCSNHVAKPPIDPAHNDPLPPGQYPTVRELPAWAQSEQAQANISSCIAAHNTLDQCVKAEGVYECIKKGGTYDTCK